MFLNATMEQCIFMESRKKLTNSSLAKVDRTLKIFVIKKTIDFNILKCSKHIYVE